MMASGYVYPDGERGQRLLAAKGWGKKDLAEKAGVDADTVENFLSGRQMQRKKLRLIAEKLGVPLQELIARKTESAPSGHLDLLRGLHPTGDIQSFGERNKVTPIDQFIHLRTCPGCRGWPQSKVATFAITEDYESLPELRRLVERFPATGAINWLYGLKSWACDLTVGDEFSDVNEVPYLYLSATGGNWTHIHALQKAWEHVAPAHPDQVLDEECRAFHRRFEHELSELINKKQSRLYCNANTEAILITKDKQIVLARRSGGTGFSHGLWSASFEEQVLRRRQLDNESDKGNLFACASRGAYEEFGVTIIPEASRLLEFGIEWGNFTAAFLMLLRCEETFDEICNWSWEHVAKDPTEAVAIDCLDATNEERIREAFLLENWTPSPRARSSNVLLPDAEPPLQRTRWHPVARARLFAYLLHKETLGSPPTPNFVGER